MDSMLYTFDAARSLIMESRASLLMLVQEDVDAMDIAEWDALRETARGWGLELEIDDDGDAIARAR